MTIGEFLTIYERNQVAFLKNRLGTSRRLQKYVGRLAQVDLADLKRMQMIEWFMRLRRAMAYKAQMSPYNNSMRCM